MPTFRRVAPSIYVADLDRAIRFYRDALGFTLDNVDDPPRRAVVVSDAAVLHLDLEPSRAGSSKAHVMVDSVDDLCGRLRAAGVRLIQEPTVQPWGLRELVVADPDGNVFEIAEPST